MIGLIAKWNKIVKVINCVRGGQWDRDLGHFIRFDKKLFAGLVDGTGWAIESMDYFFSFAVLPAFIFRHLIAPLRPHQRLVIPRANFVSSWFWRFLYLIEKRLNQLHVGPPFGTSLMVLLRKS